MKQFFKNLGKSLAYGITYMIFFIIILAIDCCTPYFAYKLFGDEIGATYLVIWCVVHFILGAIDYSAYKNGNIAGGTWLIGTADIVWIFNVFKIAIILMLIMCCAIAAIPRKLSPIITDRILLLLGNKIAGSSSNMENNETPDYNYTSEEEQYYSQIEQ